MPNLTDPDWRLMPVRGGGFIQGYHAQNVTSEDGLVIATELAGDPVDCQWFEPMLAQAQDAAALIAAHRPAASPGQDRGGPATTAMRERLKTGDGLAASRQRGHIAETPHGHIKHNMGLRQLSMPGKPKASAEWKSACAVHNLLKALSAGHLTSQALAALAR